MSSKDNKRSAKPGKFGEEDSGEVVRPSRPSRPQKEYNDGPEMIPETQIAPPVAASLPDSYMKETAKMGGEEKEKKPRLPYEQTLKKSSAGGDEEVEGGPRMMNTFEEDAIEESPVFNSHGSRPGAVAVAGPGFNEATATRNSSINSFDHVEAGNVANRNFDDHTIETQSLSMQESQQRQQSEHLVSAFLVQDEPPSIDKPYATQNQDSGASGIAEAIVVDAKKKRKQIICLVVAFFVFGTVGGVIAALLLLKGDGTTQDFQPTLSPQPTESPMPSISPTQTPTTALMQVTWFQVGEDVDGLSNNDQAGRCVALSESGLVLAVGAENNGDENKGHARLFQLNPKTRLWERMGQSLEGERGKDQFGRAISLSNDGLTVAIGSHDNEGDVNTGDLTGHVRVFGYDAANNRWNQKGGDINGEKDHTAGHFTPSFVALAGEQDIVAFGSAESSENGAQSGRVRVFLFDEASDEWIRRGQDIDGDEAGDDFGYSVDLDDTGTTLVVGAYQRDDTNAYDNDSNFVPDKVIFQGAKPGYARIFKWNAELESWTRLGDRINGAQSGDHFGSKVSISSDGSIVAIGGGSVTDDDPDSAHVRVYKYDESNNDWTQLGQDLGGQSSYLNAILGLSLSYDGDRIALGTHMFDEGHVRVFQYEADSVTWYQVGQMLDGEAQGDDFGNCLQLAEKGNTLAVGAPRNNAGGFDRGHARVYHLALTESPTLNPTTATPSTAPSLAPSTYLSTVKWNQLGNTIFGVNSGDQFGRGMSMSGDGTLVAVAGRMNDNAGKDSGMLRIYRFENDEWKKIGQDLNGENEGDLFGESVYVSRDGSTVAAASSVGPGDLDNRGPGYVKMYKFDDQSESWVQLGNNIVGKNDGDKGGSGTYIALSGNGNIVAIGADYNDDKGVDFGHVQVYEYTSATGNWTQRGKDLYGDASRDRFGFSVYLNDVGNQLVVGAFEENSGPGYVRSFRWNGQEWSRFGQRLNGDKHNDHYGAVVVSSHDGSIMAASADLADNGGGTSGLVRVFRFVNETSAWNQIGQDIVGEAGDHGGLGLSISADGTLIAVGFRKSKLNGDKVGHAGIFRYDADSDMWNQVGKYLYGEDHDDEFSRTLKISNDGKRVAIGANDGYVKIYETDDDFL